MKKIICAALSFLMCFSLFSTTAFAAKDKTVKTGIKVEEVANFSIKSSEEVALMNTKTPVIAIQDETDAIRFVDINGNRIIDELYDDVISPNIKDGNLSDKETWQALSEADIIVVGKAYEEDSYRYGFLDVKGAELVPCQYDDITVFDGRICALFKLREDDLKVDDMILIDLVSKEPINIEIPEEIYEKAYYSSDIMCNLSEDGCFQFCAGSRYGSAGEDGFLYVYDPEGKLVFSESGSYDLYLYSELEGYDYSGFFSFDDALYNENGKMITATNAVIQSVGEEQGVIVYYDNGSYGFMDLEANVICEEVSEFAMEIVGETAIAQKENKYALVNLDGTALTEFDYDKIELAENGIATAIKDGKVGFINSDGEEITDFVFDEETSYWPFTPYDNCIVVKDEKYGMIDENGKYIVKPEIEKENAYINQFTAFIKEDVNGGEEQSVYMRSGAVVTAEGIYMTDNPDLVEVYDKKKTALVDYGGNVLVKAGKHSEYIAMSGTNYVLGIAGKNITVYQLVI